jgi:hypothetical protein
MMNSYLKILFFSLAVALAVMVIKTTPIDVYLHTSIYYLIGFYALQSLLLAWAESKFVKGNRQNFVLFVIGSISFRLFTSLVVAIAFLLAVGEQNTLFIISFFALYLLFLGFELFMLMTNLRSNFENSSN